MATSKTLDELCQHEDPVVDAFLKALRKGAAGGNNRPKGKGTIESYRGTIDRLCRAFPATEWADITTDDLYDFLWTPKPNGDVPCNNTVCQRRSAIVQMWRWMTRVGWVEEDVTTWLPSPGQDDPQKDGVPDADWNALMECPLIDPDARLALGLGYFCGMRRSEIVALTPEQVSPLTGKILFLQRKGGKTKKGLEYRTFVRILQKFRPEVAGAADQWLDILESMARFRSGMPYLWSYSGATKNDGQKLRDMMEHHWLPAAGIDPMAWSPHALRHSFATNMILCGYPIELLADAMSHSSMDTTREYVDHTGVADNWFKQVSAGSSGPGTLRAVQ